MEGDCTTEWCWQNRWYRAHGYRWDGSGWSTPAAPHFFDSDIAQDLLGEAGIYLSGLGRWSSDSIKQMAYGVSLFASRLGGGINQLKSLLGVKGLWTITVVDKTCAGSPCAPPLLSSAVR